MVKLKVLDVMHLDDKRSMVALQGISWAGGYTYLVTDDGKKYKIIGAATQSVEANKKKIVDLMIDGDFNYTEAELI